MTTATAGSPDHPTIRPAQPPDLLAVFRLERQCFPQPWPFEAFHQHLDATAFLVAVADGRVVGYVVGSVEAGFPAPVGHVKDLAVHPAYRRQGIAQELLARALARFVADGAVRANLEVRTSNDAAIALYRESGFSSERIRPGYYADGEAAVVMTRSLS